MHPRLKNHQEVVDAITEYYTNGAGNPGRGNHSFSRNASDLYEQAKKDVARFINAHSAQEIVFTRNTTESINLLSHSLKKQLEPNDVIVLSGAEHHSNLTPWLRIAQEKNATVEYIPVKPDGSLDWNAFLASIKTKPVKILAISHISNVLGTINPVRKIILQAKEYWQDIITIVDAAQSVAHIPISIEQLHCDFLAFSGHKLYGPDSVGVLYGHRDKLRELEPYMLGGGMVNTVTTESYEPLRPPSRFEAGTVSTSQAVGLSAAIKFLESVGMKRIHEYEQKLTEYALTKLSKLDVEGLEIHGSNSIKTKDLESRIGVISLSIDDIHSEDLANYLSSDNVMVRAGHHCAMPLHTDVLNTDSTLRISISLYNIPEDIDLLTTSLQKSISLLK